MDSQRQDPPQIPDKPVENQIPQLINRVLENQAAEIEIRRQELDLRRQELDLQREEMAATYKNAQYMVEAQLKDREQERNHEHRLLRNFFTFVGIMIFLLLLFLAYAIHADKEQIAMEIVKAIIYLAAGALGGYGLSRARHRENGES
ncbi:hypothetical protein D6833_14045 [Candidatus Parcubacteria bacterium]|nr:MAG: hypothetical protein D6833_14045 [Candidatus Parcubacteria bacterium]